MTKNNCIKPVAAVIGAALVGSLAAVSPANAAENPFAATQLQSGYMVLASSHEAGEMKEGEGKCGGEMKAKEGEGKCGGEMKAKEGEGKCGEGKCGGDKK